MTLSDQPTVGAIITARGGSKGIPRKNIRLLGGKPLIAHTIVSAHNAAYVDRVFLSTDCSEIADVARQYGCEVPFMRDSALASDEASSLDVIIDALDRLPTHDIWLLLQPTSPLRTSGDIDRAVELMIEQSAQSCTTITEATEHPWLVYSKSAEGKISPYAVPPSNQSLRRQDLPEAYVLNGCIYGFKAEWLKREMDFVTDETVALVMPRERSIDIDTFEDLQAAEILLQKQTLLSTST